MLDAAKEATSFIREKERASFNILEIVNKVDIRSHSKRHYRSK